MNVKLVSISPEAEQVILYCARVSSNQENTDPGLLRYLIRNRHWSPFELAHMVLEIDTSRAIAQQILRHRSFSFQEFSQRYAAVTEYEDAEARVKGSSNRQGSVTCQDEELATWWQDVYLRQCDGAFATYQEALDRGIAPEVARMILPMSTATRLYMSGTIRSWIHYLEQRCDEHTQLEHRLIALEAQAIFCEELPVISAALGWRESP